MNTSDESLRAMFDLTERVAVVTGASSGLGEQFARTLAEAGAVVVAVGRRPDRLKRLIEDLPGAAFICCDVAVDEDLRHLADTVHERFGRVDVLINNAGVVGDVVPAQRLSRESFEHTLAVNLIAPFRLSGLLLPDFRAAGGGSIINVASISGVVGIGRLPQAAYAASKAGLIGLTRELALQWARYDIRVNSIAPGFFESEMTAPMFESAELAEWVETFTPLRHRGHTRDFAGVLLLLASPGGPVHHRTDNRCGRRLDGTLTSLTPIPGRRQGAAPSHLRACRRGHRRQALTPLGALLTPAVTGALLTRASALVTPRATS